MNTPQLEVAKWMTAKELAFALGVSVHCVWDWGRKGRIKWRGSRPREFESPQELPRMGRPIKTYRLSL